MAPTPRSTTHPVRIGKVVVGGGAPVVVQSMANTDTADAAATARQCLELARAGSELVRVTVNVDEAAAAVPEIRRRLHDAGCDVPLIGDFHYNGHLLLARHPDCATALDKYRINPGNVGFGRKRDEQFSTIVRIAVEHGKPVRIGVNGGSLDQELVMAKMQENTDRDLGRSSEEILNECMVLSALQSTELGARAGPRRGRHRHLLQGVAAARPDRRLPRSRRAHPPAAASRADRGGHGDEGPGLVGDRPRGAARTRGSATRSASRSPPVRAATGARRSTPPARCCSRSACAPSRPR